MVHSTSRFLLGQYLLWNGVVFWCLWHGRDALGAVVPHDFRTAVAGQPGWLRIVEVVLLSDFFVYWGHRLQHRSSFLWRFHSVHHSAEHLDWLAAHREHPLDTVYTLTLINLPAFVLGFPLDTLAGFIAFRGIWAIYIHSNVRLPLGPLRPLLGAPELHHWHHAKRPRRRQLRERVPADGPAVRHLRVPWARAGELRAERARPDHLAWIHGPAAAAEAEEGEG